MEPNDVKAEFSVFLSKLDGFSRADNRKMNAAMKMFISLAITKSYGRVRIEWDLDSKEHLAWLGKRTGMPRMAKRFADAMRRRHADLTKGLTDAMRRRGDKYVEKTIRDYWRHTNRIFHITSNPSGL
jgi:hypothetical protein